MQSSWLVSITSLVSHTPLPTHATAHDVQLYWQELQRARVENGFLVLANGARFGGTPQWGSRIFLRSSYSSLWARIKELVEQGCGQILVTGDWEQR